MAFNNQPDWANYAPWKPSEYPQLDLSATKAKPKSLRIKTGPVQTATQVAVGTPVWAGLSKRLDKKVLWRLARNAMVVKKYGKPMVARKCIEYNDHGKHYYYKDGYAGYVPQDLRDYLLQTIGVGGPKMSVLINYYEGGSRAGIGWHTDRSSNLQKGSKVYSLSFAMEEEHRSKASLGYLEFGTKGVDGELLFPAMVALSDHSVVSWDPHLHTQKAIQHRVSKTLPRLNITVRMMV